MEDGITFAAVASISRPSDWPDTALKAGKSAADWIELRSSRTIGQLKGMGTAGVGVLLDWFEAHPGLAGWVGAGGAVLALFVTIFLNRADARERRIEREARARTSGVFVKPPLVHIRKELKEALGNLDRGMKPQHAGPHDDEGFTWGIAGIDSPPSTLTERLPAIADLGPAAKVTQAAYRTMQDLHESFERHYIEAYGECAYDDQELTASTIALMRRCLVATEKAIAAIDRLYE